MRKFITSLLISTCLLPCIAYSVPSLQDKKQASAFLLRTTFGPTMVEIDQLAERIEAIGTVPAFTEWIDEQFLIPPSGHNRLTKQMEADDREHFNWERTNSSFEDIFQLRYKHYAWWHLAITSKDQLRQRMAWALSQIFVVSSEGNELFNSRTLDMSGQGRYLGLSNYYDLMVNHAYGNYRDLLYDVSLHPIMGWYLSHVRNSKGDGVTIFPDENYAREVMQLFSIGLVELNVDGTWQKDGDDTIPTYTNEHIKAFARVFTGLSFEPNTSTPSSAQDFTGNLFNFSQPMIMYEAFHDADSKNLLNGVTLPASQTGLQDINGGIDNLFNHQNVGPFIGRRLIQRFVMSNPSKNYIQAVAEAFNDNGSGVRGDFPAVIKAVLLNSEAIASLTVQDSESARLREPVLRYSSLVRAFGPTSEYYSGRVMIDESQLVFGQIPYRPRHVFNFYLPDYQPPGDILNNIPSASIPNAKLFAPEYEVLNAVTANELANRVRSIARGSGTNEAHGNVRNKLLNNPSTLINILVTTNLDYTDVNAVALNSVNLVDDLDLLLCGGGLSSTVKTNIATKIDESIAINPSKTFLRTKVAVAGVVLSPGCAVQ